MNKILPLFDEQFVVNLFREKVLPQYPAFKSIARVVIKPYKKLVWETTYHVVVRFDTYFVDSVSRETKIPIVCSAHSDEARENVFLALKYLWAKNFSAHGVDLPRPLFYFKEFNGTFYRGLKGENLLYYIKKKDFTTVEKIVVAAAELLAKLHALPAGAEANFNPLNSRIETVIPGVSHILQEMAGRYGDKYHADLKKIYDYFIVQEDKFFNSSARLTLIHGDAHPENVIQTSLARVGLIDFTDLCLGDFARDLGSFLQQLDYKITTKVGNGHYAAKMKELFLHSYLSAAGLKLNADLQARIDLYYNWTAIRTATFWFLKFGHNEKRAEALLSQVKTDLKL
ncbi:MAG: phosphotransferase [Patescibacteria group bacterium]